jgi:hypothetical protein
MYSSTVDQEGTEKIDGYPPTVAGRFS